MTKYDFPSILLQLVERLLPVMVIKVTNQRSNNFTLLTVMFFSGVSMRSKRTGYVRR